MVTGTGRLPRLELRCRRHSPPMRCGRTANVIGLRRIRDQGVSPVHRGGALAGGRSPGRWVCMPSSTSFPSGHCTEGQEPTNRPRRTSRCCSRRQLPLHGQCPIRRRDRRNWIHLCSLDGRRAASRSRDSRVTKELVSGPVTHIGKRRALTCWIVQPVRHGGHCRNLRTPTER
jgi:hypothetical protein